MLFIARLEFTHSALIMQHLLVGAALDELRRTFLDGHVEQLLA